MPTLRTFTIEFSAPLFPRQIPFMRGAVKDFALYHQPLLQKNGFDADLFCNESDDEAGNHKNLHRYPLVQYKIINRQAAITGIQQGAEALQLLWKRWEDLKVNGAHQVLSKSNSHSEQKEYTCKMLTGHHLYRMYHWLALNPKNEKIYRETPQLEQRVQQLQQILTGHILTMASGCGWEIKKDLKVFLGQISHIERNQYKEKQYLAFDCTFGANVLLPQEVGLGNGPAFGFGKIQYLPVHTAAKTGTKKEDELATVL